MADDFECSECGRSFDSDRGLSVHKTQSHGGENEETGGGNPDSNEERIDFSLTMKQALIAVFMLGIGVGFLGGLVYADSPDTVSPEQAEQETPEEVFSSAASDIGADAEKMIQCVEDADDTEPSGDRTKIMQEAGRIGTPTFFIGNSEIGYEKVSGAQPYSNLEPVIDEQLQEAQEGDTQIEDDELRLESIELEGEPSLGQKGAAINFIEYSDFACPWCAEWNGFDAIPQRNIDKAKSFDKIKSNYVDSGQMFFVYKDFPAHENSMKAHKAANCVYDQDESLYWKFHDKLFETRDRWMAN